jgi:hypothetical protein
MNEKWTTGEIAAAILIGLLVFVTIVGFLTWLL